MDSASSQQARDEMPQDIQFAYHQGPTTPVCATTSSDVANTSVDPDPNVTDTVLEQPDKLEHVHDHDHDQEKNAAVETNEAADLDQKRTDALHEGDLLTEESKNERSNAEHWTPETASPAQDPTSDCTPQTPKEDEQVPIKTLSENQLEHLEATIKMLKARLDEQSSIVAGHSDYISDRRDSDLTLNPGYQELESNVKSLRSRLHDQEHDMDRLRRGLATVRDTYRNLDVAVERLGSKLDKVEALQVSVQSDIQAESRFRYADFEKLESRILELDAKIDRKIGLVDPISREMSDVIRDINNLRARPDYKSEIAGLQDAINLMAFDVKKTDRLEKKLSGLGSRIDAIENTTNTKKDRLASLSKFDSKSGHSQADTPKSEHVERVEDPSQHATTPPQSTEEHAVVPLSPPKPDKSSMYASATSSSSSMLKASDIEVRLQKLETRDSDLQRITDLETVVFDGSNIPDKPSRLLSKVANIKDELVSEQMPTPQVSSSDHMQSIEGRLAKLENAASQNDTQTIQENFLALLRSATTGSKERSAEINARIDSIETRLQAIDQPLKTCSNAPVPSSTTINPTSHSHRGKLDASATDGLLDHKDHDIAQLSTVSNDLNALREDHASIHQRMSDVEGRSMQSRTLVEDLWKLYKPDFNWLSQRYFVLSNRLEAEIMYRQTADAKLKMFAARGVVESNMQCAKIWEFFGTAQLSSLEKRDALQQFENNRSRLRWWDKRIDATTTREELEPILEAIRTLCNGKPVPDEYAPYTAFPEAGRRLRSLAILVEQGLPPQSVYNALTTDGKKVTKLSRESAANAYRDPATQQPDDKTGAHVGDVEPDTTTRKRKKEQKCKGANDIVLEADELAEHGARKKRARKGDKLASKESSYQPASNGNSPD